MAAPEHARDLGVGDDWRSAPMPPVNVGLLDGQLAWRRRDGGHTDASNWKHFLAWADRLLGRAYTPAPPAPAAPAPRAPTPRAPAGRAAGRR